MCVCANVQECERDSLCLVLAGMGCVWAFEGDEVGVSEVCVCVCVCERERERLFCF